MGPCLSTLPRRSGAMSNASRPMQTSDLEVSIDRHSQAVASLEHTLGSFHPSTISAREYLNTLRAKHARLESDPGFHMHHIHPGYNDPMIFNRDIKILDSNETWVHAIALLDTQCQAGNWISNRLARRLGITPATPSREREREDDPPTLIDGSGRLIQSCGTVDLTWRWHNSRNNPRGAGRVIRPVRNHETRFHVLPEGSDHLEVIFGVDYILENNLLAVNEGLMLPLVRHKKSSEAEKAAIAQAKERQRKEKAARDEARRKKQQQDDVQGGGGAGQNGGQ